MTKTRKFHGSGTWTPEADELLAANLGMLHATGVASKINSILGSSFTGCAIEARAFKLGLDGRDCQGLLTISEAARQLNVNMGTLWHYVNSKDIPTTGKGRFTFLTEDGFRQVQKWYRAPPVPSIPSSEAARRLGYHPASIRQQWREKKIPGHAFGGRLLIPLVEVERREREQRGQQFIGEKSTQNREREVP
jgi:transposase-like protein